MKTLVTAGTNPDLDGLSSALGYVELLTTQGEEAIAGFEGKPQLDAEYLLSHLNMPLPNIPDTFDQVVLVDLGNKVYAPRIVQRSPELVIKVIDHRILHNIEMEFPSLRDTNIDLVGACATLVTEELYKHHVIPSRDVATLLHAAIHSNTLNLKAGVTTERDLKAVANLTASYSMSQTLIDEMFAFRTRLSADQMAFVLKNDFDAYGESPDGNFGIAQLETLDATSLFHGYAELIHQTLIDLKATFKLKYVFLTVPSIRQGINYIYAVDEETTEFLHRYLRRDIIAHEEPGKPGRILKTKKLLLRKQIKPIFQHIPELTKD
jgi:inorganic pyrophosphatase/exopolyphosphatase